MNGFGLIVAIALFLLPSLALHATAGKLRFSEAGQVVNSRGWTAFLKTDASEKALKIINVDSREYATAKLSEGPAYPVVFDDFIFLPYIDGRYEVYSFDGRVISKGNLPSVNTFGGAEVITTKGEMAIIAVIAPTKEQKSGYELLIVEVEGKELRVSTRQEIDRYGPMGFFRGKIYVYGENGPLEIPVNRGQNRMALR